MRQMRLKAVSVIHDQAGNKKMRTEQHQYVGASDKTGQREVSDLHLAHVV